MTSHAIDRCLDCGPGLFSVDGVAIGRAITAGELTGTFKRNRDKYRVAADSREASLRQLLCLGAKTTGPLTRQISNTGVLCVYVYVRLRFPVAIFISVVFFDSSTFKKLAHPTASCIQI